jgi:uncharacterized Zn finger protein (UPF0148 family)
MALITCDECGKSVSTKASTCPHCGAPVVCELKKSATAEASTLHLVTDPPIRLEPKVPSPIPEASRASDANEGHGNPQSMPGVGRTQPSKEASAHIEKAKTKSSSSNELLIVMIVVISFFCGFGGQHMFYSVLINSSLLSDVEVIELVISGLVLFCLGGACCFALEKLGVSSKYCGTAFMCGLFLPFLLHRYGIIGGQQHPVINFEPSLKSGR